MTRKAMKDALTAHKARKAQADAAARVERKVVAQEFWIEAAREDEIDGGPYRMCTTGGQRFGLSALDAIRAQQEGLEFRPAQKGA